MSRSTKGVIYKGIGGFYYVKTQEGRLVECKARGIFRKRGQKPLAGDRVILQQEADAETIIEILPRHNALVRPPVANVDQLFIVVSTVEPVPSFLMIDKLTASAYDMEAVPILVITKPDLSDPGALLDAYATVGIQTVVVHAVAGRGLDKIHALLNGKLNVFCGNTGVGKSTLLNALAPELERETGQISRKLGRGRHTTREVEIFEVGGGLVADTPGFASFDVQSARAILPENMQLCFPEIKALIGRCKFSGCAHVSDAGCAVLKAVEEGKIAPSRHQSYVTLYNEAKQAESKY